MLYLRTPSSGLLNYFSSICLLFAAFWGGFLLLKSFTRSAGLGRIYIAYSALQLLAEGFCWECTPEYICCAEHWNSFHLAVWLSSAVFWVTNCIREWCLVVTTQVVEVGGSQLCSFRWSHSNIKMILYNYSHLPWSYENILEILYLNFPRCLSTIV